MTRGCTEHRAAPGNPGNRSRPRLWYRRVVEWSYADIMSTVGALSALVAAIGVMLTSRKVDVLTGRVDEHGRMLQAIVTAMVRAPEPGPGPAAPQGRPHH